MKMPIKSTLPKGSKVPQEAPKIEFPCANYPIKVVGQSIAGYDTIIIEVMRRHDPSLDIGKVQRLILIQRQIIKTQCSLCGTFMIKTLIKAC